ncbi:hypothetical protein K402DRAFT_456576 [Aulographum hederae CBS 113979]|uniref:Uncharacterized protein n=1 Tax=Aulographum hederae CBS 113979 TaxID=1176131 RepID=A0A6G1GQY1_9PEZI|nr:hypothetical protein K402DRAFT_456576 [Aulographum hederae CBS 113979]
MDTKCALNALQEGEGNAPSQHASISEANNSEKHETAALNAAMGCSVNAENGLAQYPHEHHGNNPGIDPALLGSTQVDNVNNELEDGLAQAAYGRNDNNPGFGPSSLYHAPVDINNDSEHRLARSSYEHNGNNPEFDSPSLDPALVDNINGSENGYAQSSYGHSGNHPGFNPACIDPSLLCDSNSTVEGHAHHLHGHNGNTSGFDAAGLNPALARNVNSSGDGPTPSPHEHYGHNQGLDYDPPSEAAPGHDVCHSRLYNAANVDENNRIWKICNHVVNSELFDEPERNFSAGHPFNEAAFHAPRHGFAGSPNVQRDYGPREYVYPDPSEAYSFPTNHPYHAEASSFVANRSHPSVNFCEPSAINTAHHGHANASPSAGQHALFSGEYNAQGGAPPQAVSQPAPVEGEAGYVIPRIPKSASKINKTKSPKTKAPMPKKTPKPRKSRAKILPPVPLFEGPVPPMIAAANDVFGEINKQLASIPATERSARNPNFTFLVNSILMGSEREYRKREANSGNPPQVARRWDWLCGGYWRSAMKDKKYQKDINLIRSLMMLPEPTPHHVKLGVDSLLRMGDKMTVLHFSDASDFKHEIIHCFIWTAFNSILLGLPKGKDGGVKPLEEGLQARFKTKTPRTRTNLHKQQHGVNFELQPVDLAAQPVTQTELAQSDSNGSLAQRDADGGTPEHDNYGGRGFVFNANRGHAQHDSNSGNDAAALAPLTELLASTTTATAEEEGPANKKQKLG